MWADTPVTTTQNSIILNVPWSRSEILSFSLSLADTSCAFTAIAPLFKEWHCSWNDPVRSPGVLCLQLGVKHLRVTQVLCPSGARSLCWLSTSHMRTPPVLVSPPANSRDTWATTSSCQLLITIIQVFIQTKVGICLNRIAVPCISMCTSQEIIKLFPEVAALFGIPARGVWDFWILPSLLGLGNGGCLIKVTVRHVWQCLTVAFLMVFLWTSFTCLVPFGYHLWWSTRTDLWPLNCICLLIKLCKFFVYFEYKSCATNVFPLYLSYLSSQISAIFKIITQLKF